MVRLAVGASVIGWLVACAFNSEGGAPADGLADGSGVETQGTGSDGASTTGRDATTSAPDGSDPTTASASASGSTTMPGDDTTGPSSPPLVDRGLLTRYFIAEPGAPQGPRALIDATPDPLSLPIDYIPELSYTERAGHRGLTWTQRGLDGIAGVPIVGTKIGSLHGRAAATIEVVAAVAHAEADGSRLSHIGPGDRAGDFSLVARDDGRVHMRWHDQATRYGEWSLPGPGRVVLHMVLDASQRVAEERLRLYIDGELAAPEGDMPDPGSITLQSDAAYVIGNRETGQRSIEGTIYYAALYTEALTADEVATNAALLLFDDDAS